MTFEEKLAKVKKGLATHVNHHGGCEGCPYEDHKECLGCIRRVYEDALAVIEELEKRAATNEEINILCVEDGSVDTDIFDDPLKDGQVIVYRQGSRPPFVLKLK